MDKYTAINNQLERLYDLISRDNLISDIQYVELALPLHNALLEKNILEEEKEEWMLKE